MKIMLSPNSRTVYDKELVDQNSSASIIKQIGEIGKRLYHSEQLITPEAITTTVLGAVTFQSFMEGFEPFMEKSDTAPISPALNDLWYDTSVTPNLMKRWDGSAWINSSFTQTQIESTAESIVDSAIASYDADTVNGLESRIASAETALTPSSIVSVVRDSVSYKADLSNLVPTSVLSSTLANYSTSSQTSNALNIAIGTVNTALTEQGLTVTDVKATFQFLLAGLLIGKSESNIKLWLASDKMAFTTGQDPAYYTFADAEHTPVMYITTNTMYIKTIEVTSSIVVGSHKIYKDTALGYTLVQKVG